MLRITRTVATVAALGTTLALAGSTASASAATAISDLPDTAPLVGKLYVPVTLTLACDGDPWFPFPFGGATVTIKQLVSGKNIAHGSASVGSLTCDGAPHAYTANVFPDSGAVFPGGGSDSPPFAKGDAVISAQMLTYSGSVTAGPEPIRLTK